jgi:hypothetical protein
METKEKKSFNHYIRALHRDIGFFAIGLTIIYAISGIVLIYRETGFLKSEKQVEKQLSPNIKESELGMALHLHNFQVTKTEGDVVYFQNGTYNNATGVVKYTDKALPAIIEKLNSLHKKSSRGITYLFSTIFGLSLLFLAISSFWMFKPNTRMFRRGLIFAGSGIIITIILLFL